MLMSFIRSGDLRASLLVLLLELPIVMLSLSLHETAHGYVAYKCGDGTAKAFGRLTLNPVKHLDPLGTLFMFLFGYGWAKPVPVNSRNLRRPKRDIALVSLAGPLSNLLLALVFCTGYMLLWRFFPNDVRELLAVDTKQAKSSLAGMGALMCCLGTVLNIGLALFNLIPLPPLDGSNILLALLPQRLAVKYVNIRHYTRYIFLGIVVISWVAPVLYGFLLLPLQLARSAVTFVYCLPYRLLLDGATWNLAFGCLFG